MNKMEIPGNADLRYTGTRKREYLKGGTTNEESLDFVRQSPQGRQELYDTLENDLAVEKEVQNPQRD